MRTQYIATLNPGNAYAAVILSTPVTNSDNDGILDAWKAGPGGGRLPCRATRILRREDRIVGAIAGRSARTKGSVRSTRLHVRHRELQTARAIPTQENLFPSPDPDGNDPLAMVQQAFATNWSAPSSRDRQRRAGRHLHGQRHRSFASSPASREWSAGKTAWNSRSCGRAILRPALPGGDCTARFPYGQKDSYHYVLFGHSLAIPAWNTRYGSLTSITVSGGVTTIVTADRGSGINACPSRITISGVLGNPNLNGVYNTTACADTKTIIVSNSRCPQLELSQHHIA